jgi:hypothetical protein
VPATALRHGRPHRMKPFGCYRQVPWSFDQLSTPSLGGREARLFCDPVSRGSERDRPWGAAALGLNRSLEAPRFPGPLIPWRVTLGHSASTVPRRAGPTGRAVRPPPTMLRPCVLRAVVVDVPEIPRLARNDRQPATRARHITGENAPLPQPSKTLVIRPITPRDRLLRRHQTSTLKNGEKRSDCAGVSSSRLHDPPYASSGEKAIR